ncbi:MAG TPA: adenylate/guanylate cyclase domain-containing protein [Phycisphaerales bacterium]|nr:adenylate/guanylate cyclase domain-containing protein [Phycisphaerales bacterium]
MNGNREVSIRIDWGLEIIDHDEISGQFRFKLSPNPERYEWRGEGADLFLYDKLDQIAFPESVIKSMKQQLEGVEFRFQPQTAGNIDAYIDDRLPDIRAEFAGTFPDVTGHDRSLEELEGLVGTNHEFAIVSIDLVGSTALSSTLPPQEYARLIRVYVHELSRLVTYFHGHVLKYTGDGVLAFFAAPSLIIKTDHALDYAACAIRLVQRGLNPIAAERDFPPIQIRAGLDSGSAAVAVVGHDATKQHPDLIGKTVNLACKIQSIAPVNGVAIGDFARRHLHTRWRNRCSALPLPLNWPYRTADGSAYPVMRFD